MQNNSMRYIECDCGHTEHMLRFFVDDEDPFIFVYVQLTKPNFFKRLWRGLRYIFGYQCKYGHWDEILWGELEIKQVKEMCEEQLAFIDKLKGKK